MSSQHRSGSLHSMPKGKRKRAPSEEDEAPAISHPEEVEDNDDGDDEVVSAKSVSTDGAVEFEPDLESEDHSASTSEKKKKKSGGECSMTSLCPLTHALCRLSVDESL